MQVEIWSDVVCPWCYVGKRRFEEALAGFEHRDEVQVRWRSFELDPEAPGELQGELAAHLARKYGRSIEQARAMQQQLTDVGAGEGLDFRFDQARSGKSFEAHRLLHLAGAHNLQDAMKERLLRAYFTEGELISDTSLLKRLAGEVGLPAGSVDDLFSTDRYADEVREDEQTAAGSGIRGVPFFLVDRRLGVSGAQPAEVLGELLRQGWEERPATPVAGSGESCGVEDAC